MAKSRNPLKDLSDLTEMPIVKNWNISCSTGNASNQPSHHGTTLRQLLPSFCVVLESIYTDKLWCECDCKRDCQVSKRIGYLQCAICDCDLFLPCNG